MIDITQKTDQDLVEEVLSGQRQAFSELVRRYQKSILRLSMRFTKDLDMAQDVVQETFIKAYEKLGSFEGRSQFRSWLFQIAVNTAKNKLRDRKHQITEEEGLQLAVHPEAEASLIKSALSKEMGREVEKLPIKQRTALILRIYEDLSFKEIADIMECPYDTAKANYRHALLRLREVFEHQSELKSFGFDSGGLFSEIHCLAEVDS